MKNYTTIHWGQYAGKSLPEIPVSYLLTVLSFESPDTSMAVFIRKAIDQKVLGPLNGNDHTSIINQEVSDIAIRKLRLCSVTEKQSFTSEKSAKKRMREIQLKPGANHYRVPQNVYQCEFCDWWHLTSRESERRAG